MVQRVLAAVEGGALLLPPVFGVTHGVWQRVVWFESPHNRPTGFSQSEPSE